MKENKKLCSSLDSEKAEPAATVGLHVERKRSKKQKQGCSSVKTGKYISQDLQRGLTHGENSRSTVLARMRDKT